MDMIEWVFWGSVAFVAYTYAGYPALLAILASRRSAPRGPGSDARPGVSIVIVAHDEERHIDQKMRDCLSQDYQSGPVEVLVASDGSRDRTDEIVGSYASKGVRLFCLPGPRGKPTALNHVVPRAAGEIVVLTDARQRLDPGAVSALVERLADPAVGAVSGELHIVGAPGSVTGAGVGAYWCLEKWLRRMEARIDSTVGVTGAIYAIRRDLFPALPEDLILDDVAVPMAVVRGGHRVVFEGRAQAFDTASTTAGEFRRKVRTLAGNLQLVWLEPWLLNPWENRLWWQLVSHKLARLVVPWALAAILATGATLGNSEPSRPFYAAMTLAQLGFYGTGLVGWLAERSGRRIRLLSVPAAFCLLNAAAVLAALQFASGRSRANWKSGGAAA